MAPKNNPCGVSTLQKQKLLQTRPQGQAQTRTQGITTVCGIYTGYYLRSPPASGQGLSLRLWLRDFATDLKNN